MTCWKPKVTGRRETGNQPRVAPRRALAPPRRQESRKRLCRWTTAGIQCEKPLRGNLWNEDGEGTPGSRVPRRSSAFDVSSGRGARRQFSFAGLSPDDHRSPRQRGTGFRPIRRDADPVGHEGQETVRRGRMVLRGTSAVSRLRSGVEDGLRASLEGSPHGFLGATP